MLLTDSSRYLATHVSWFWENVIPFSIFALKYDGEGQSRITKTCHKSTAHKVLPDLLEIDKTSSAELSNLPNFWPMTFCPQMVLGRFCKYNLYLLNVNENIQYCTASFSKWWTRSCALHAVVWNMHQSAAYSYICKILSRIYFYQPVLYLTLQYILCGMHLLLNFPFNFKILPWKWKQQLVLFN